MGIFRNLLRKKRSNTRNQLEEWLGNLEIAAEAVADVGGKQLPVKDRVRSWQVQRYDLLDLPEYDLNQPWDLKEIYNIAFCLEVFEYIYNPMQAVLNLYSILKSGGELYISFHFIYPHHSGKKIDYLRYTRWGVDKLLQEAGFKSWDIYPRYFKNPQLIEQVYLDENMRGDDSKIKTLYSEQGYLVKAIK
jgi:SAM-dependent methyltransferase